MHFFHFKMEVLLVDVYFEHRLHTHAHGVLMRWHSVELLNTPCYCDFVHILDVCRVENVWSVSTAWPSPIPRFCRSFRTSASMDLPTMLQFGTGCPLVCFNGTLKIPSRCWAGLCWVSVLWPMDASSWLQGPHPTVCQRASWRWSLRLSVFDSLFCVWFSSRLSRYHRSDQINWRSMHGVTCQFPYGFTDGHVYDLVDAVVLTQKRSESGSLIAVRREVTRAVVWAFFTAYQRILTSAVAFMRPPSQKDTEVADSPVSQIIPAAFDVNPPPQERM